ncbi:MAG: TRAP transporter substrate-binding protein [Rhodospirillaceae bacterium]|nr:TRAP transporter substrate-binding protein [Rhodospirillaceae bacterium]MDE0253663.1 TRAP transporter substrate-binding protein [Rhodospirillaceae bacterium]MDE0618305.1 TRAP transporter substrate-binding protein [Rhodospirillaceae bacterium]
MRSILKAAAALAATAVLTAGIGAPASAADIKAGLMLKKGFPGAEPVNGMFELFEAEVEKGSGGAIKMEIVYGGALGKPNERLNQVRHGIIQMSDASDGNYASIYKDIQILSMPYLFPDEQTAWKLLDGPVGTKMAEDIRKKTGIRVLGWWESGGFKHYSANRAIRKPDDMKGLKMRVMAPIFGIPVLTLGGSATPIAFPELYTSLKTGVVDGQDNAVWVFNLIKLHEVQKFLMLDGHIYAFGPLGINDRWFAKLSDKHKAVVLAAGKKAIAYNRKASRDAEAKNIAMAKERGVTVIPFTREMKQAFADRVRPAAIAWLKKNVDTPALVDEIIAEVARLSK